MVMAMPSEEVESHYAPCCGRTEEYHGIRIEQEIKLFKKNQRGLQLVTREHSGIIFTKEAAYPIFHRSPSGPMLQCCCKWTQLLSLNRLNNDLGTRTFPTVLDLVLSDNGSKGKIACTTYPAYLLQRLRPSPRLFDLFKLQPSGVRRVWCVAGWDSFVHVESLEYIQCAAEP